MELKINRETIPVTEMVLEELQEQSIELDYVLPDYEPDIFRIIGCEIQPSVLRESVAGDRVSYELSAEIRVLYCGSGQTKLACILQQMNFSRSALLPEQDSNIQVQIRPRVAYQTCRAISPRRLEVRGAVAVQIQAVGQRPQTVIQDAFGMHIQLKKEKVTYAADRQTAVKSFVLSEEIPLGETKPPVCDILRSRVRMLHGEQSVLAGKVIAKGEAGVQLLYRWQREDGTTGLEQLEFSLPFSQIVDMPKIKDNDQVHVASQPVRWECKPTGGKKELPGSVSFELELRLCCTAIRTATTQLVTDAFSTVYPCTLEKTTLKIPMPPISLHNTFSCATTLKPGDSIPSYVHDLHCQVRNVNMQFLPEQNQLHLSGMLCVGLLAEDAEKMPMLLEKEEAFETTIAVTCPCTCVQLQTQLEAMDSTYHLSSDGTVSVQATLLVQGVLYPEQHCDCLSQLHMDSSTRLVREQDCALKLYYGVEQEDIWEIAKRCHTSVRAILEENDLTEEKLTTSGMLFIPIVQ